MAQTNLATIDLALPISSLEAYVTRVKAIPMLSQQEEHDLAERYYFHNDLEAARKLIISNLRFVVRIARAYNGYGLAFSDLIQEGNIGLMKAVKRFNPRVGVRLVSFAVHWIKAEIQEFVLRNWRIVKVATTKAQRKLFFNLRKTKEKLAWLTQEQTEAVAKDLAVKAQTVREMEMRLQAHDTHFDAITHEDEQGGEMNWGAANYLEDHRYDPARQLENDDHDEQSQIKLEQALAVLDPRSREIVQARWLDEPKATLHDLAASYQISAERVRQLEQNAMKKLRLAMQQ